MTELNLRLCDWKKDFDLMIKIVNKIEIACLNKIILKVTLSD